MKSLIQQSVVLFESKEREAQAIIDMEAEKSGMRPENKEKLSSEGDCVSITIASMKGDLPEYERLIEFLEDLSDDDLRYLCAFMRYGQSNSVISEYKRPEPFSNTCADWSRTACLDQLESEGQVSMWLKNGCVASYLS